MPSLQQFASIACFVAMFSTVASQTTATEPTGNQPTGNQPSAVTPHQNAPSNVLPNVGETPFRVDIQMFVEGDRSPFASRQVLFSDGSVYDMDTAADGTITVYDLRSSRVILLDRKTKVVANISTQNLIKLTAGLHANAIAAGKQAEMGIGSTVKTDREKSEYAIHFGGANYQTTTQTATILSVASDFAQYTDWALRLNIPRKMGLPPFGRMTLNHQLAKDNKLPATMKLSLKRQDQISHFRSTHDLTEKLTEADRALIDQVAGMLVLYKEVPLKAFP